jgi:amino acid adenylation domain-containing protein
MRIEEFLNYLQEKDFHLVVENGKLILKGDREKLSAEAIAAIRSDQEVISYIRERKDKLIEHLEMAKTSFARNHAENISSIYRLSGLQQGILFHSLYDTNTGAYVNQMIIDVVALRKDVFVKSWEYILEKHSILRSAFHYDSFKIPVQCVYKHVRLPLQEIDLSEMEEAGQNEAVEAFRKADLHRDFDFKTAPLMRIGLLKLGSDRYKIIWSIHHIAFDGWSGPILMEEFLEVYDALAAGRKMKHQEEDRYEDYIRYIERRDKEDEELYWRKYLNGLQTGTLLPFVSDAEERTKSIGVFQAVVLELDKATTDKLQVFVQQHHLTVNTMMQGVWAYLLGRYTGDNNVVFGVTVSGRPEDLPGIERRIGMYVNALPLHARLEGKVEGVKWLQSLQQEQQASRQFQYSSLNDIQRWAGIQGDLFDTMLTFQNYPVSEVINAREWGLQVDKVQTEELTTNYPLSLRFALGHKLSIQFIYKDKILERSCVEMISRHFKYVLEQLISGDRITLDQLDLLSAAEQSAVLALGRGAERDYSHYGRQTLSALFSAQAARNPGGTALWQEGQVLSYRELEARSNQLSHYLRGMGVCSGSLVGLCVERSFEMLTGILGILKAGGAYVPVDPEYPSGRIHYMCEDSGILSTGLLLTMSVHRGQLDAAGVSGYYCLDELVEELSGYPVEELSSGPVASDAAYVIYTSGSTGRPKGVVNEHGAVVNRLLWAWEELGLGAGDRVLQKTTYCFDVSVWELLLPLLSGGTVVLARAGGQRDPYYLKELIAAASVSTLHFVPSMLPAFIEVLSAGDCGSLRHVLCSGEALNASHVRQLQLLLPSAHIYNLYGPTEAAIDVSNWEAPAEFNDTRVPIGRAVANTQLYVLSDAGLLQPAGVPGELCIGGVQVARGYLNREELTQERFVADPFRDGGRMYRSGDLVYWRADGQLGYLGRRDDQLKVRGYRIELGELESLLSSAPGVQQGAVSYRQEATGLRLYGYVQAAAGHVPDQEAIWLHLRSYLPEYMHPQQIIVLEQLPLTASGKVDRQQLPLPSAGAPLRSYSAPRTALEAQLCEVWAEVLGRERVGIYDNFFELGGNSLLAMRMVHALQKKLPIKIRISLIFDHPDISSLARSIQIIQNNTLIEAEDYETIRL